METKTLVVGAIALIAILLGAFILFSQPPVAPPQGSGDYSNPLGGQNVTMEEFATSLAHAQKIYLVEDLRGLEKYPISRNNIMQCGVDFAGSEGLVGKEVNLYILEGDECSASEAGANLTIKKVSECHSTVSSAFKSGGSVVIWVEKGYSPSIYSSGLVVRVNETYSQGMCSIRFVVPAPEEEETTQPQPAANETVAGNTTLPSGPAEEAGTHTGSGTVSIGETISPEEAPAEETIPEPTEPAPVPNAD